MKRIEPRIKNRGADLLALLLRAHGVRQVTALTGGAIMETLDALEADRNLNVRIFQTEQGAAWAAMGYARATGNVGVCAVTSGPGATNTITPIADARRDNVPIIVITGQVPSGARFSDAFQEVNIAEIVAPVAKKAYHLHRVEDLIEVVTDAFQVAREGRPGPVLIDFTKDAQEAPVGSDKFDLCENLRVGDGAPRTRSCLPVQALDAASHALREACRPVVIAGYGVVLAAAERELQDFLAFAPCPVVHTLPGKAALPSTHACNYGMLGMHGFYVANWMVHHADLVLSFGSRYDDRVTADVSRFAPGARQLIHFDIDADQIEKVLPGRKLGIVGNLKQTLPAFSERLRETPFTCEKWHETIRCVESEHPSTYVRRTGGLQAQHALAVLNDAVEKHTRATAQKVIYTSEVGNHQMWAGQYLRMRPEWQFITSSGQGAMGSGLPMAIGAQLARRDDLVICLTGDGSLRFSEAELETIWEYRLPVKVLVFNDGGYGIVRMWNHRFYQGRETGVVKKNKDWNLLARASGFSKARVHRVTQPEELADVLPGALAHRDPHFIELVTPYEECLPLTPPGKSFDDIILE